MKTLVVMPTYNEVENLESILTRLRASVPDAEVLIVDDGSPDGTGDLADSLSAQDTNIHVMHRLGKLGLGTAYLQGFTWGLDRGFDVLVEMDSDGSHMPEQLPRLLTALGAPGDPRRPGLVIGSRWVPGGGVVDWPLHRKLLSRGGSAYARLMLGVHVKDVTAGFRAYSADALRKLDFTQVESQGYCFQIDMTWRMNEAGERIVEVPITFPERTKGESKMNRGIVLEAMGKVSGWGLRRGINAVRSIGQKARRASRR